jgi:hypothetical protein
MVSTEIKKGLQAMASNIKIDEGFKAGKTSNAPLIVTNPESSKKPVVLVRDSSKKSD